MIEAFIFIILFALLFYMAIGNMANRYISLLIGTILFPLGVSFSQNPTIRPLDLFLYGFFIITILKDYKLFVESFKKFPLKIPLLILLLSHFITIYINDGFKIKAFYAATREFIELYGYLFISFLAIKYMDFSNTLKKIYLFTILICILGIIEILFHGNYLYTYICRAFPIYTGYYNLDGIVSCIQDARLRANFTTAHPTAYGTLLMSLYILFASLWNNIELGKKYLIFIYGLLSINLFICGSRTAIICSSLGIMLLFIKNRSYFIKFLCIGMIFFSTTLYIDKIIDEFSQQSKGSSIDMRQAQLLFSLNQIYKNPILGNGVGFTKNIFDYDDNGQVINDETIGGLESIVFRNLIDYGFIGLFTYYLVPIWFIILCYRKRKQNFSGYAGCVMVFVSTLFFTLSGHIGNNTAYCFMLEGLFLGKLYMPENQNITNTLNHQAP